MFTTHGEWAVGFATEQLQKLSLKPWKVNRKDLLRVCQWSAQEKCQPMYSNCSLLKR